MNNAGLPGTGLGGLFYILLALWMPVAELVATVRGRSSRARWRLVGTQFALACGIVAAVAGTMVAYLRLTDASSPLGLGGAALALASVVLAAVLLSTLVLVLRLWAAVAVRRAGHPASRHQPRDPQHARSGTWAKVSGPDRALNA